METDKILNWAYGTFENEISHLQNLKDTLNENFVKSVKLINECQGRLVICGIGKSAIIAQKIVATLNSTGTPSLFLHAAEAVHGDLGMVQPNDLVLMISNSGNSPEIKALLPLLKDFKVKILAIGSNPESAMAKEADLFIHTPLKEEACPNGLAPTTSTTMQLLVGDALAVCLIELKKFGSDDFSKYHPGGSLGKKLYLNLKEIYNEENKPNVDLKADMPAVVEEVSNSKLGAVAVLDADKKLQGIITDGDLRRALLKHGELTGLIAEEVMSKSPQTARLTDSAYDTFQKMEEKAITQIVLVNDTNHYQGLIHLHEILKAGVF